ncbi:MAG: plasmid partition protein [Rhodomicrobium sp.]
MLLFHELTDAGISKHRLAMALCRVLSEDEEKAARGYLEAAGYEVLPGSIPESAAYRAAHNRGRSLIETDEQILNEHADALMEALLTKVAMLAGHDDAAELPAGTRKGDAA